jgi:hypothetical protein
MAVDLGRRDEEGVVKVMDLETSGAARQQRAGARGDLGVDRVDAISEARDDRSSQLRSALPRCD